MNPAQHNSLFYVRNPDVILREEDPDGGLLFNPDTNQVKVLNHTGLFIWKLCDGTHDLEAITSAVQQAFEGVPEEQVSEQIKSYISVMMDSSFIGVLEN